jgi:hypothetical protein
VKTSSSNATLVSTGTDQSRASSSSLWLRGWVRKCNQSLLRQMRRLVSGSPDSRLIKEPHSRRGRQNVGVGRLLFDLCIVSKWNASKQICKTVMIEWRKNMLNGFIKLA